MKVQTDADSGMIEVHFGKDVSERTSLLMDSMVLGLKTIQKEYKNKYIQDVYKRQRLSISSTERTYNFVVKMLEAFPKYCH